MKKTADPTHDEVRQAMRIANAARKVNEARRAHLAAKARRNRCECDKVLDHFATAYTPDGCARSTPEPCWKRWEIELGDLCLSDPSNYCGPEDLDPRDLGWCESCAERWRLHPEVIKTAQALARARAGLTNILEAERRAS